MTASTATTPGCLYVVATPIGNMGDLSKRAIQTLEAVDNILAEDTRHSKKLLSSLGIQKPLHSLHAFNENKKSISIIHQLLSGKSIALISDAGTPLISDPGYPLLKLAYEHNIQVSPIPGPCALTAALSAAGVPSDIFTFAGFLPAKTSARKQQLEALSLLNHTLIFYESTHRIKACIEDVISVFGSASPIVLAKELTKTFERMIHGSSEEILSWLNEEDVHTKGEFVLIIPARPYQETDTDDAKILTVLIDELPLKQAVKIASQLTGKNKNELYQHALDLKKQL